MSGWTVRVKSFAELRASLEQASEECLLLQTHALIANAPAGAEIDLDQLERHNAVYRREAQVVIDAAMVEAQANLARWRTD